LYQAGFWLSFVAVGVLFAASPPVMNSPKVERESARYWAWLDWTRQFGWLEKFWSLVREQWVVTWALTPLSILFFGQISVVGLLANLLAIPWVTLVITPLAMLGVVVGPLWSIAAGAVALLSQVLQWLAELPFAVLSLPQAPLWAGVVGLLGGVLLVAPWPASLRALGLPLLLREYAQWRHSLWTLLLRWLRRPAAWPEAATSGAPPRRRSSRLLPGLA
jgi:competence protein ComEC